MSPATIRLNDGLYISKRYILALATYREARGETLEGKLWVAQTIENRVQDFRWPQTYREVILQPWQFSSFNKNDPNTRLFPPTSEADSGREAWNQCWEVAGKVLDDYADVTDGCNHYYATYIGTPKWAKGVEPTRVIGKHVFLKL